MTAVPPAVADGIAVGIVGAGSIAAQHIDAWQSLGADVAIHSPRTAREVAARRGLRYCADLGELFAAVDVVVVCTPTDTHFALASAAVAAGRPVLCEKPLTRSAVDARAVAAAAARAGVPLVPAHVVRFFPAYELIAAAVGAGRIGQVHALRLSRTGAAPQPTDGWFGDVRRSGGLLDLMVHDLDVARWLAGDVVEVVAGQHPGNRGGRIPEVVTTQVMLTHRSGALSQLHAMWRPVGAPFRTTVEVWGDGGCLRHDSGSGHSVIAESGRPLTTTVLHPPRSADDPFRSQAADVISAHRQGSTPRVTAADGVAAVVLMDAVLESIDSGAPVSVAPDQR
jgi:myo-inositol 2-dehydrogenase/D-chiro-inositol 1-dehydrogenase